ncbi:MAG: hypothetical protein KBT34_04725 [Prevotella sp.]|nr:hypothetical protein [Candidatus Prevotella equi]
MEKPRNIMPLSDLPKKRSYVRCIADGYRFLGKNLFVITKVMLPWCTLMALFLTLMNLCLTYLNVCLQVNKPADNMWVISGVAAMLLTIVSAAFAFRRLFKMWKRMSGMEHFPTLPAKSFLKAVMHNTGNIIGVVLLGCLLTTTIGAILVLPYVISINAYFGSIEGEINFGDTVLIPWYGYALMLLSCVMAYALAFLLFIANLTSLLYLYFSVITNPKK